MQEIWKDIKGYEGLYQVSNLGRIKTLNKTFKINNAYRTITERIIKTYSNSNYIFVSLHKNGKRKQYLVHRLVGQAFIPNSNNYPCINHKDENKENNRVDNLEWCSYKYNNDYGKRKEKAITKQQIKINQYDLEGNFIKEWNGINEAIRHYKNNHISSVCTGRRKTACGYIWKYKERQ